MKRVPVPLQDSKMLLTVSLFYGVHPPVSDVLQIFLEKRKKGENVKGHIS
jgi:hypothetical protein